MHVTTLAGAGREFGEPFGAAVKDGNVYISDGEQGKIFRVSRDGKIAIVSGKFATPSAIAFDRDGFLIVADSGSSTIKKVDVASGETSIVAGVENKKGFADGKSAQALFNAPVGVTVSENKIFVADTYNDKIRVIENDVVSTLAGGEEGFADAPGTQAKFDTPCGIAALRDGSLIVADTENRRLRRVEPNGNVTTLAGNGEANAVDGFPLEAKFAAPTTVAVDNFGAIYVADGDVIRAVGRRFFPFVETISDKKRGFADGNLRAARFNRPSGLATDENGNLFVADADNQAVRVFGSENSGAEITDEQIKNRQLTAEEFRHLQPARWCYNPPEARRDVAGTLGEVRGEIADGKNAWFHNGLDVAGSYGETARFVRAEKVLRPVAVENFGGLRELIRLPTTGYIHIRLGRDKDNKPFDDDRFEFRYDERRKLKDVRVPRGARFEAGEAIGTLNPMNHVHLIAGRSGAEMNALDALVFPNIADTLPPTIEKVSLFDENWRLISETENGVSRIKLAGKTRVTVRAFDRMDGNAATRRLGVYRLGYQIFKDDNAPVSEINWTISFDKMPVETAVKLVYARGSQSGYSPQTVFDYIVTNEIRGAAASENFFDTNNLETGNYILRVFAADYFGNTTTRDVRIEIVR